MIAPQDDSISLVRQAKLGNQEAFASLVLLYENELCGYLTSLLLRDKNEAQDYAQQVFFKAWEKIYSLKEEKSFKPWLYKIARNMVYDSSRCKRKIPSQFCDSLEKHAYIESSSQVETKAAQKELINLALAELPPMLRECLCLAILGCSRYEIAQILGICTSSVGTYLCMARKQFRQSYSRLEQEP